MQKTASTENRILEQLEENGRISNIEIARKLGLSEATVRQKIKKLVSANSIRFKALVDFQAIGVSVVCLVRITASVKSIDKVISDLEKHEEIHYLSRLAGMPNILVILHARDNAHLNEVIHELICKRSDVKNIDAKIISSAVKFDSHWAPISGLSDTSD